MRRAQPMQRVSAAGAGALACFTSCCGSCQPPCLLTCCLPLDHTSCSPPPPVAHSPPKGVKRCPECVPLWRAAARVEEAAGAVGKARAVLEQARQRLPKRDDLAEEREELWLAAIRTEQRAGNSKAADALLAKALQELPAGGRLWAEAIASAPRPQRKTKSADALKRCDQDPAVIAAVANLFWQDRKVDKARSWFNRAVLLAPDVGDYWAQYLKFEVQHGTPESAAEVVRRCAEKEPRYGERWTRVAKDVRNAHAKPEVLLKKTVVDLDTLPPP